MAAVVVISGGRGLRIEACHRNQPNKSKLCCISSYFHFNIPLNSHTQATRWSASVMVGEECMGIHVSKCLKEELVYISYR